MYARVMRFDGKVAFITGASRGVGRCIALALAREGADIVVAAKTVEPNPRLPGTIHTTAAEVEALRRRALPVQVDVRDENAVASRFAFAEGLRAGSNNLDRLRVTIVCDKESVSTGCDRVAQCHRFSGGGCFIEE